MQNSPDLKLRYAAGMGDVVACILHSRYVSWLTKLITGKDKPCFSCSQRRAALNILFPIPVWKMFFDTENELLEYLSAEYRALGYKVEIDKKTNRLNVQKATITHDK